MWIMGKNFILYHTAIFLPSNFLGSDFAMEGAASSLYKTYYFAAWDFTYKGKDIYATNKNFPDCTAKGNYRISPDCLWS